MSYEIADEPSPSDTFGNLVFRPSAPLLAIMMCGAWLAWPWFVVNSYALGSPTRRREVTGCVIAVAGTIVLAFAVFGLVDAGVIESRLALQLALLGITSWKLGMAYWISQLQSRTFEVYTYYGGAVRPAYYVLVSGIYLTGVIVGLSSDPLWRVIVGGGL